MTAAITYKKGRRIRIFVGEAQAWQGRPLYQSIVEAARQHGVLRVVVFRGIEGFGPEHHLSTDRIVDISENLPIVIDIIEREERIASLLPILDRSINRGMMTMTAIDIVVGAEV
ncbi:UPF0166 protein [Ktedonobacteria bacterium brp13]|nr:UPF0166 protein [Ktedonobacteria bacterium brp13]